MAIVESDPLRRGELSYAFVTALGYGHLLGAASFAPARERAIGWQARSLRVSALVTLFALYGWLLDLWPEAWVVLLCLSVWHTAENDLCLADAYADDLRLPSLPSRLRDHAVAVLRAGLLLILALAVSPRSDLLAEVFVASTLYHLVSWLLFFVDRARALRLRGEPGEARRLRTRLLWAHGPPIALAVVLARLSGETVSSLHGLLFAPGPYLFWSVLHVLQTARARARRRGVVPGPTPSRTPRDPRRPRPGSDPSPSPPAG